MCPYGFVVRKNALESGLKSPPRTSTTDGRITNMFQQDNRSSNKRASRRLPLMEASIVRRAGRVKDKRILSA